jgi:hypothetical protein
MTIDEMLVSFKGRTHFRQATSIWHKNCVSRTPEQIMSDGLDEEEQKFPKP